MIYDFTQVGEFWSVPQGCAESAKFDTFYLSLLKHTTLYRLAGTLRSYRLDAMQYCVVLTSTCL